MLLAKDFFADLQRLAHERLGLRVVPHAPVQLAQVVEGLGVDGMLFSQDVLDVYKRQARGGDQCGTLGSGNHFLEVQVVDEIFDLSLIHI